MQNKLQISTMSNKFSTFLDRLAGFLFGVGIGMLAMQLMMELWK